MSMTTFKYMSIRSVYNCVGMCIYIAVRIYLQPRKLSYMNDRVCKEILSVMGLVNLLPFRVLAAAGAAAVRKIASGCIHDCLLVVTQCTDA